MKRLPVLILALLLCGLCPTMASATGDDTKYGILVLAHGGSKPEWNATVEQTVREFPAHYEKTIVFGMGDAEKIQEGIDRLAEAGVKGILVVPLFISPHSEMYRQIEYILGEREEPDAFFALLMEPSPDCNGKQQSGHSHNHGVFDPLKRVHFPVPHSIVRMSRYPSVMSDILRDKIRAGTSGLDVAKTTVILVAHGPISFDDNEAWLADMREYAESLGRELGIKVLPHTLRDDAPDFIRDKAIGKIRADIESEKNSGQQVLLVPFMLAPGGREGEVGKIAKESGVVVKPITILPHPAIPSLIKDLASWDKFIFYPHDRAE